MGTMVPGVTDAGRDLIVRGVCGERITFVRFGIGNGLLGDGETPEHTTQMKNELLSFGLTGLELQPRQGFARVEGRFDNSMVQEEFRWTEMGLYACGENRSAYNGTGSLKTFVVGSKPAKVNAVLVAGAEVEISSYDPLTGKVTLVEAPPAGTRNVSIYYPDGEEQLYAYANCGEDGGVLRGAATDLVTEQVVSVLVAIGAAEHVTAIVGESALYASKTDFENHVGNRNNPHGVTAADVQLGNVENAAAHNMHVDFTEADGSTDLISGETLGGMIGKISRVMKSAVNHIANRKNPHGVTAAQIGAAKADHKHSTADLTSGVLGLDRGGTGLNVKTLEELRSRLGLNLMFGVYTGNGAAQQDIVLGYKPAFVLVLPMSGLLVTHGVAGAGQEHYATTGGLFWPGHNLMCDQTEESKRDTDGWTVRTAGMVTKNGFRVGGAGGASLAEINTNGNVYYYVTMREVD